MDECWRRLLARYRERFPEFPDVETLTVENINCAETEELVNRSGAELVLVSGTRLVRERLLSLPIEKGILNLHTGLSPYVKGGLNCTNWCLSEGNFHLIGNTVMWIDAGIDSGNIVTTERVPLAGDETLDEIHWKVMEHAHQLYLDAVALLVNAPEICPSIRQESLGEGTTYYARSWGWRERRRLLAQLEQRPLPRSGHIPRRRRPQESNKDRPTPKKENRPRVGAAPYGLECEPGSVLSFTPVKQLARERRDSAVRRSRSLDGPRCKARARWRLQL